MTDANKIAALETRLSLLEQSAQATANEITAVKTEVQTLRARSHEHANLLQVMVVTVERLKDLPAQLHALAVGVEGFKGKLLGGLAVLVVLVPLLTGVVVKWTK